MKHSLTIFLRKTFFVILSLSPLAGFAQQPKIQYLRAYDQSGINVFETPKETDVKFEGLKVRFGAGFTQQFQAIKSENPGAFNNGGTSVATAGANKLYPLTPGFMTAQANLYTDVQLADGIRLNLTTYLSARHHNEAWVKGGYIQFDKLPFKAQFWNKLMKFTTIKVGHYEVNYGDAHFRRPDGGHTLYSPFMEGNIMDAFATEIGGDITLQKNGFFGMFGMTNGMIKGSIDTVLATSEDIITKKRPSYIFKLGVDKQLSEKLRVRVSGSMYQNSSSAGSGLTLYGGDRTGSNYQNAFDKWVTAGAAQATTAAAFSGRYNPGFSKRVTAFMFNGLVKAYGFELFATYEMASGKTKNELFDRKASQYAAEVIYRIGKEENLFIGARYNAVRSDLPGFANKVDINRYCVAAGWFITKNVLMKAEYVNQQYKNFTLSTFPENNDYRYNGKFNGIVFEAIVGF